MKNNDQNHFNFFELIQEALLGNPELAKQAAQILLNQAMIAERQNYIGAEPWQRAPERRALANGFRDRTLKSKMGFLSLKIPTTRDQAFFPQALERYQRSDKAIVIAMGEMYIKGVSTRKVTEILEELCGCQVSSATVSRAAMELDPVLEEFRQRELSTFTYLILDACYFKIRKENGISSDDCALIAIGINAAGKREILGVSLGHSEAEIHWREFLQSLLKRGLNGVSFVVSDDHQGLRNALKTTLPNVTWQRCQFHLQRNAQKLCPRKEMQKELTQEIRDVFQAPELSDAEHLLKRTIAKYDESCPKLASWMEKNIPEGFAIYQIPKSHRKKLRTTNSIERVNKELKRRTNVIQIFPSAPSLLRALTSILMNISESWSDGRTYINFDN